MSLQNIFSTEMKKHNTKRNKNKNSKKNGEARKEESDDWRTNRAIVIIVIKWYVTATFSLIAVTFWIKENLSIFMEFIWK